MLTKGERVYLRKVLESDAREIHQSVMEEEIRYLTGTKTIFTYEQVLAHIQNCQKDPGRLDFMVCLNETDEAVGEGGFVQIDRENQMTYFRIAMLGMANTGRGYGTEAVRLAVNYALREMELNRIQLEVYSHNSNARKAYEKAGFQYEGTLRQTLNWAGVFSDEIIMSVLKEDLKDVE